MGAGFHGGFGGTKGASGNSAPVNSSKDVRYSKKKTEGYLLNSDHPKGGSKAKFMKDVLGYSQSDSKLFHKNVVIKSFCVSRASPKKDSPPQE